ncbi:hypothetical protein [Nocardiopsis valliformis]|uniref:hypothetical protein n=1 Tax=Nocardiopsis valliformis TaxID=239974 RepID=UPI00034CE646|nr:hypothetical protein [Nocardiopsis valliformis]
MANYARMYRLGFTPWERYGPAAGAQLRSWLERESTERESPGRALDIGCFQGLDQAQQSALARGATALANPGATLLMLAFGDSLFRRMVEGVSQTEVEAAFQASEWELRGVEAASTEGLGFPMNRTNPQWYRFRRISS